MNKIILKKQILLALAAAVLCVSSLNAQTNTPAPEKKSTEAKPVPAAAAADRAIPFHGTLTALDETAKTFTLGKRVFQVTSTTKFFTGTKTPATFKQAVLNEEVRGTYKKAPDGKLVANTVFFGAKPAAKPAAAPSTPAAVPAVPAKPATDKKPTT